MMESVTGLRRCHQSGRGVLGLCDILKRSKRLSSLITGELIERKALQGNTGEVSSVLKNGTYKIYGHFEFALQCIEVCWL